MIASYRSKSCRTVLGAAVAARACCSFTGAPALSMQSSAEAPQPCAPTPSCTEATRWRIVVPQGTSRNEQGSPLETPLCRCVPRLAWSHQLSPILRRMARAQWRAMGRNWARWRSGTAAAATALRRTLCSSAPSSPTWATARAALGWLVGLPVTQDLMLLSDIVGRPRCPTLQGTPEQMLLRLHLSTLASSLAAACVSRKPYCLNGV